MICNGMYISTANPYDSMHKQYDDYTKYARADIYSVTKLGRLFDIKKVVFNAPATIVFWSDGTKTVVKCGDNDEYDPEKGLAMAIAKRALGNEGNYYNEFKKWLPEKIEEKSTKNNRWKIWFEYKTEDGEIIKSCYATDYASMNSAIRRGQKLFDYDDDTWWTVSQTNPWSKND